MVRHPTCDGVTGMPDRGCAASTSSWTHRRRCRFRSVLRGAAIALTVGLLGACAPRGELVVLPEAETTGTVVGVLSATSRGPGETTAIGARERSETLRWAEFRVSVPPRRETGTVTYPRSAAPNPETDFLIVSGTDIADERWFLAALNAQLGRRPREAREVTLFVHGFNSTFAEGLYRHAQMAHDFNSPGVSLFYSWPSAGSVMAYPFDRESALFARDGLEQLASVVARSTARDMVLVGHSMGALVVMEAVRQMAIRRSDQVLDKLQAVVLIAPDLDVDVFRMQVAALTPREVPIYLVVSGRDRALRVAGLLRGQDERLGSIREAERVSGLPGVFVLDVTDVRGSGDPLNHFAVVTSPAMIALLSGLERHGLAMLRDDASQGNVFEATLGVVSGVTQAVLQPLAR